MDDRDAALRELEKATAAYKKTKAAFERAQAQVVTRVVAALQADAGPAEVARHSPFTDTYVRAIARENGVPPASPGKKSPRGTARRVHAASPTS